MNSYDVVVLPLTRDQFIQTGGNVHMVCRSKQRGEEALEEIKKESGNDVCCLLLQKQKKSKLFLYITRMHSSRMRTGRLLTVCWSVLPGGGLVRGGAPCSGGGGVCSGGGGGFSLPGDPPP